MTRICVSKLTIIGSDNGLSPGRRLAIIWNNGGILSIGPSGTNFSEILIGIKKKSLKKVPLIRSPANWRPCYPGLNELSRLIPDNLCRELSISQQFMNLWTRAIQLKSVKKYLHWHKIENDAKNIWIQQNIMANMIVVLVHSANCFR